jgi:hypothetical protein
MITRERVPLSPRRALDEVEDEFHGELVGSELIGVGDFCVGVADE